MGCDRDREAPARGQAFNFLEVDADIAAHGDKERLLGLVGQAVAPDTV